MILRIFQKVLQKYHLGLPLTEEEDSYLLSALEYEKGPTPLIIEDHTTLNVESWYSGPLYR